MEDHPTDIKPESWLVSAGRARGVGAPLNVPLVPASNFIIGNGREYSRDDGTPTWEALEELVGGLESGKAVAFASGMAAIAAVFDQLATGAEARSRRPPDWVVTVSPAKGGRMAVSSNGTCAPLPGWAKLGPPSEASGDGGDAVSPGATRGAALDGGGGGGGGGGTGRSTMGGTGGEFPPDPPHPPLANTRGRIAAA